jgi:hypothetical protein
VYLIKDKDRDRKKNLKMIIKNKNFLLKSRNVQEIKTRGLLNANLKPGPFASHILKTSF